MPSDDACVPEVPRQDPRRGGAARTTSLQREIEPFSIGTLVDRATFYRASSDLEEAVGEVLFSTLPRWPRLQDSVTPPDFRPPPPQKCTVGSPLV